MTYDYALITPARNEGNRIAKTLESIINQTRKPVLWVIVNDGSTDNTADIVGDYALRHDFIKCISVDGQGRKNFSSKVNAFNRGLNLLSGIDYSFIGNLDADVSFEPLYFQQLLQEFQKAKNLGLAGGLIVEYANNRFREQKVSINSVAGAVQLFRREAFEQVGGYFPMKYGGVDSAIEIKVRMKGWEVRTFPDLKVIHHGPVVTGKKSPLQARFNKGIINYTLGYHPLFQCVISIFRMLHPPFILGGLLMMSGYFWAALCKTEIKLPEEVVRFLRAEQLKRLKNVFTGKNGFRQ